MNWWYCVYVFVKSFLVFFFWKGHLLFQEIEKMNQSDFSDEILRNIGGKSKNNLNEILNNFTDTDFEIDTFSESPYIDIDSLSEQLIPHTKKFSVLSVNIQSINAKFDKLLALITYLNDNNFMFSAICIQESWLKQGQDISLFQIPGYNLINQPKVCSEHGGLIIYLKREYTHNVRDLYKSSDIWEGLFIDVFHENTNKKITIGNIYRPPKDNNSNPTIENFIQQINILVWTQRVKPGFMHALGNTPTLNLVLRGSLDHRTVSRSVGSQNGADPGSLGLSGAPDTGPWTP